MNKVDGWAAVSQPIPLDRPAWFGNNQQSRCSENAVLQFLPTSRHNLLAFPQGRGRFSRGFARTGPSLAHHSTAADGNDLAIHLQDVARNDTHR